MSMKPGATTSPVASRRWAASAPLKSPIFAILPFVMPTSAVRASLPVPSMTEPCVMSTS